MAKKPWGTITHPKERDPDFLMGYQKLSGGKIRQMVDRLYVPDWSNRNERKQPSVDRRTKVEAPDMGSEEIEKMVDRLSRDGEKKATDCNRTGSMRDQGVVNTYAWKGWNWMAGRPWRPAEREILRTEVYFLWRLSEDTVLFSPLLKGATLCEMQVSFIFVWEFIPAMFKKYQ